MIKSTYFKQTDVRVSAYYNEHKDMFGNLKGNIITWYKKYMNEYSVKKLEKMKHIEENGYKYLGVTDDWLLNYSELKYKINGSEVTSAELSKYMPTQAIFVTSVVYSIYTDLQYITYLYNENLTQLYLNEYAKDIDLVLSRDSKVNEIKYCRKFNSLGLGIPSLLLGEYNKLYNEVVLTSKCVNFYKNIGEDYDSYKSLPVKIIDTINSQVMSGKLDSSDVDMALLAKSFREAYAKCLINGIETVESLLGMSKQLVYKTQAKNGLRLSTIGEINSRVAQLMSEENLLIDEQSYLNIVIFVYLCTGNEKYLESCNASMELDNILKLGTKEMIRVSSEYVNSVKFTEDLMLMRDNSTVNYPLKADDEIKERGLEEKLNLVIKTLDNKNTLSTYEQTALDIAKKGIKGKSLSDKQVGVINSLYSEITSGKIKENYYSSDVEDKIKECNSYFSYKNNKFITNLFTNVLKYKKCSEKQLKVIDDEYNKMLEYKKTLLEQENQYVVKNTKQKKGEENRGLNNIGVESKSKKSTKSTRKTKKEIEENIAPVVFGDYTFEDTDI